jgi:hypothetical protein
LRVAAGSLNDRLHAVLGEVYVDGVSLVIEAQRLAQLARTATDFA